MPAPSRLKGGKGPKGLETTKNVGLLSTGASGFVTPTAMLMCVCRGRARGERRTLSLRVHLVQGLCFC